MTDPPITAVSQLLRIGADVPSLFRPESTGGQDILTLSLIVFGILAGVAISVWIVLTLVIVRRRGRDEEVKQTRGNLRIELLWTAIPAVIVAVLFYLTLLTTGQLVGMEGPTTFTAIGHQWWWELDYGAFKTANEIHAPEDHLVTADLQSADVIHSFWVPQMGGKVDMIPGHTNHLGFVPTTIGTYLGECSEFCGHQHGRMRFLLIVESLDAYRTWLDDQVKTAAAPTTAAARAGARTITTQPCAGCHTIRGAAGMVGVAGPDLTHFGSRRSIAAVTLPNTPGDLAAWIRDPQQVKPGNLMPTIPLTGRQLSQIVAYLEGLK